MGENALTKMILTIIGTTITTAILSIGGMLFAYQDDIDQLRGYESRIQKLEERTATVDMNSLVDQVITKLPSVSGIPQLEQRVTQLETEPVGSERLSPTIFEKKLPSEFKISGDDSKTSVMSLDVDFPKTANYLIFASMLTRHDQENVRMIAHLKDEGGNNIGITLMNSHPINDIYGSQGTSIVALKKFEKGGHEIVLEVENNSRAAAGYVREANIIAIPFTQ